PRIVAETLEQRLFHQVHLPAHPQQDIPLNRCIENRLDLFPAFYHWGDRLSFLSALLLCLHDPHPPNKDKPYCCGVILYPPQNKELTFGSLPKKEHPSLSPYNRRIQNKAAFRLLNRAFL